MLVRRHLCTASPVSKRRPDVFLLPHTNSLNQ
jgi:hypothetical protein